MLKIQFKVKVDCSEIEEIKIAGSLPQLGNWNPDEGFKLRRINYSQWQSIQPLRIQENKKFEFKLVKVRSKGEFEWEKLPNNSNRKFKAKYHAKLIITWSQPEGKMINETKGSYKVKGYPGAILQHKNREKAQKKQSNFDPYKIAMNSDSQKSDEESFSFLNKKNIENKKVSMNLGDIEEIYYNTTQLQIALANPKKTKIYLITKQLQFEKEFHSKICEQAQEMQEYYFKWLYFVNKTKLPKFKRISFCSVPESNDMGNLNYLNLNQFTHSNSYFIFLDEQSAEKTHFSNQKACLYVQGQQYDRIIQNIELFEGLKFIVFDDASKNEQFFNYLNCRKMSIQEIQQSDAEINSDKKAIQNVTLSNIINELKIGQVAKSIKLNTIFTISEKEALKQILEMNSVLLIDYQLFTTNKKLFNTLIDDNVKNRTIIIISQGVCTENLKKLATKPNIISVSQKFSNFRVKGKHYQPLRRHNQIIDTIKLKSKLHAQHFGGEIIINEESLIYRSDGQIELQQKIQKQINNIFKENASYFRISKRKDRVKLIWNLAKEIRLIRTLCRLKYLSEGCIGNFYIISVKQNFEQLKQQVKMLVAYIGQHLLHGKETKVYHYGYGSQVGAKYTIIMDQESD